MRLKPRTWVVVGLLCCIGVTSLWWFCRRHGSRYHQGAGLVDETTNPARAATQQGKKHTPLLVAQFAGQTPNSAPVAVAQPNTNSPFWYRLSNTEKTVDQLGRSEQAILLRNALIDTSDKSQLI